MVNWFMLSIRQLGDRAILAVLAKSLLVTLVIFALGAFGLSLLSDRLVDHYALGPDSGMLVKVAAAIAALAAVWLLFRAVAIPVMGIFADEVVAAVEAKHYPDALASARKVGLGLSMRLGLSSVLRLLGVNLLALPLYLLLMATALGHIILFVVINAALLGRDMGEMVAVRHLDRLAVKAWLRNSRMQRLSLGVVMTGLFMVPLANLLAPIIGAAMATHVFHGRKE